MIPVFGDLDSVLERILCCPACRGGLCRVPEGVCCQDCQKTYLWRDGILCFDQANPGQQQESQLREQVADRYRSLSAREILKEVALYHCIPVMRDRAARFRRVFSEQEWVIDIGCGNGYYWAGSAGAKLILCDFAFNNLLAAKKLLSGLPDVLLLKTDASGLPLKDKTLSGLWSVQVTQHMPLEVFAEFQREIQRVLLPEFCLEIYNFNPSLLHRTVFKLCGKKFHCKGQRGHYLENKLNARELLELWREFAGRKRREIFYSEYIFHPNFRMFPQGKGALFVEKLLTPFPGLTQYFAEQIGIRINGR
ncbi:MAG: methyltransferase domain-containing protein [Candidatus Omnitrophica bacterium]|nr:methyltransferase domain-containing protein [Candidatus Omnitrophota bacterium]